MEVMVHPLVPCILAAAGLMLAVFLFVTLKQELQRGRRSCEARQQAGEAALGEMREGLAEIATRLAELEQFAAALPKIGPPQGPINTTRRAQVLQMGRRGEPPEQIAAALGLPRNEVELVLKMRRIAGA